MKRELGISPMATNVHAAIESLPEVQDALQKFEQQEGTNAPWSELVEKTNGGGTPGVPHSLLKERNLRIIELYQMGLMPETIRKHINSQERSRRWGMIAKAGSVARIVSEYYRSQHPPIQERKAYDEGLREAMFSSMELLIEKASLYMAKRNQRDDWKPFEYMAAMEVLSRMMQAMVDNRNWNASKMNPRIAIQQNINHLAVFDKNAQAVIEHRELLQPVIDLLDELLDNPEEANG
jgi:hypothetical protein